MIFLIYWFNQNILYNHLLCIFNTNCFKYLVITKDSSILLLLDKKNNQYLSFLKMKSKLHYLNEYAYTQLLLGALISSGYSNVR